jgi:uncharacterized repeat protein (TIGR01451 family)
LYGQQVTYSASVTGNAACGPPAGCVTFKALPGGTKLGKDCSPTTSGDVATFSVVHPTAGQGALAPASYTVSVDYEPTPSSPYTSNSSKSAQHTVQKSPVQLDVSTMPPSSSHGDQVLFKATVSPKFAHGVAPTGQVIFTSGNVSLCPANVEPTDSGNDAVASCSSSALPAGNRLVTATYGGDPNYKTNSASVRHQVTAAADLAVTVSGDAYPRRPHNQSLRRGNGLVAYTVTITNKGPDTAHAVHLSDTLPAAQTTPRHRVVSAYFVRGMSSQPHCAFPTPNRAGGQQFTCQLGSIASGDSVTVTVQVSLSSRSRGSATHTSHFTDSASVSASTGDSNPGNDADQATIGYRLR